MARKVRRGFCDWVCGDKWVLISFGSGVFCRVCGAWSARSATWGLWFGMEGFWIFLFGLGVTFVNWCLWCVKRDMGLGFGVCGGKWTPAPALAPNED